MTINRNHTYAALLARTDPKAVAAATIRVEVESFDPVTAKMIAEAKAPGYSTRFSATRVYRK